MVNGSRPVWLRYGVAILAVVLATILRLLLDPLLGQHFPFATIFFAILVVAWYGGFGPSLTTTLAGAVASFIFLLPPRTHVVLAGFENQAGMVLYLLVGIGISVLGGSMRAARQRAEVHADELLQKQRQLEQAHHGLQQQREQLHVTLASIGDAVIATDPGGRVTFLNPVAEQLTGWGLGEAEGRPLAEVFNIVNEQTRKPVENPVEKVLRVGGVVGLANHTILIARGGQERPIEDSAAPIRDGDGNLLGIVLVFRDVSRKRALDVEQGRLAALFESSEDAILGQTFEGVLAHWNAAAERLFGWSAGEAVGRSVFSFLVPPDRRDELLGALRRVRRGEQVEPFATVRLRKNGRTVPVSVRISPIRTAEGEIVGASAIDRDISRQHAFEQRRSARLAISQVLAHERDEQQAVTRILEAVCTALQWDAGCFWQVDPEENGLRCRNFWQAPSQELGEFRRASLELALEPGRSLPGRAWQTGRPVWMADVTVDPHFIRAKQAKAVNLHGGFACPVVMGRQCLGVIEFFSHEIQEPDEDLLEMMTTVAGQVGQFIERLDSDVTLRRQGERLKLLWEAAAVLLTANDPDAMMRELFAKVAEHLGVDTYFNFVVDETGEALRLVSCIGVPDETVDSIRRLEFGQTLCSTIALKRQPIVVTHIQESGDPKVQLLRALGVRTYAGNPLIAEGQLIGTLAFASRTKDRFDQDELSFLETLCHYVTFAYVRLRLLEQLQETDRRKDDFLATLAHELRNPLAPIRNGLEVIRRAGDDRQTVEEARAMMERQLAQMVRLIDDLLDISRITRNKLELRKAQVELRSVIESAVETAQPLIDEAGHQLTVGLPPGPVLVDADPTRLAQVFANLLTNSAKYTEQGGRIWLSAERHGSDAVVSVRDTGIGIAAEHLPKLFEMFSQVTPALERSQGGLGIGLALVKGLVEMHGGSIEARSDGVGKGSEFTVRIPLLITSSRPAPAPVPVEAPPAEQLRILVVDDNKLGAKLMALTLELEGHEVHTAHDGQEAVTAVSSLKPDVILLDIGLPRLNGYEACRQIRQLPEGDRITMIALTGWGQEEDKRKAHEAGFDHHCTKPVDVRDLKPLLVRSRRVLS
jgi:PAS domain S-box-containing protein